MNSVPAILADPDALDKQIIWRMGDPRFIDRKQLTPKTTRRNLLMQKQLTIELRVDLADKDRVAAVRQFGLELIKHWLEYAKMVGAGDAMAQQPQGAYYSDDFFQGHEEIDKMEDVLANAKKEFADVVGTTKREVNDELVEAMRELNANG